MRSNGEPCINIADAPSLTGKLNQGSALRRYMDNSRVRVPSLLLFKYIVG
ncbi:hypothetical protein CY0110_16142 [Crocosphaera chwakensis CCY0110]|uniref:Uncharacterized protein n=1 Tax=Crocosphaera chwakensis CCY0110 TaxID=391612 RepID=A3IHR0_9CHRO|nr:hypothetical protein CY0110_16142 [Crocosphaera chwakensis CCY0110]